MSSFHSSASCRPRSASCRPRSASCRPRSASCRPRFHFIFSSLSISLLNALNKLIERFTTLPPAT
ncbi:hypothetical protein T11_15492 [Trichinella zimbabwensis]|uniref:Uncharacterized protein n=1 Tax=Trichinella zimbabwensis TaxID=268475 RepID=A0A0V1GJV7_9BILA|nr:hypothetical protein T11_15492 [Trichinella zimbabwensis]